MTTLRLVTLNAGLLPGVGGWSAVPYIEERAAALGALVAAYDPDVVALQEVYRARHRRRIAAALARRCPYALHSTAWRPLDSGLVVLARAPIRGRFVGFRSRPIEERLLAARGAQACELAIDGHAIALFNVHATAGGLARHPESPRMEHHRGRQLDQLAALAGDARGCRLIVGDLNTGPEASPANLRRLLAAGWHDCGAGLDGPTWDPANPLNARGPHRTSPRQRIDHVLAATDDVRAGRVRVRAARRILLEPAVAVAGGATITASDHAGVLVELELELGSR